MVLGAASTVIVVSAVSGHEIATKYRLGKPSSLLPVSQSISISWVLRIRWQPLPLSIAHAQLAARLPGAHKDPFDRMLAAQALVEDIPLVTNDMALAAFGVRAIW